MRIRLKFDNTRIRIDHKDILSIKNSIEPSTEAAFFEVDPGLLNLLVERSPLSIINYLKKLRDPLTTSTSQPLSDQVNVKAAEVPEEPVVKPAATIPATGHDIFNYMARFGTANFQIQAVMKLDGKLDHDMLLRAIRMTLDAEPVLASRFVESVPPYWERRDPIVIKDFCSFEETDDLDGAVTAFLETSLDMDNDPMVQVRLISNDRMDALCVKINHVSTDGTGAKEYLALLSSIYSDLCENREVSIEPKVRSRRDQDELFRALQIEDPESAWNGLLDIPKTMWPFHWLPGPPLHERTSICQLPQGHIDILHEYGKERGATVNDLLLTAFYRVMFELFKPSVGLPLDISATADLRRYLPEKKTEAMRCFSGGFDTRLARVENETFDGTLSRVAEMMKEIKKNHPGLQGAIGLERIEKENFAQTVSFYRAAGQNYCYINQCLPVLSNLGFISQSALRFGEHLVTDAYIVPPAICAPGLLLCIGTYNGILTMAVSYYKTQAHRELIDGILYLIKKELIQACK